MNLEEFAARGLKAQQAVDEILEKALKPKFPQFGAAVPQSRDPANAGDERECRKCGCTHSTPCWDSRLGTPCAWAEPDLCTACLTRPQFMAFMNSRIRGTGVKIRLRRLGKRTVRPSRNVFTGGNRGNRERRAA